MAGEGNIGKKSQRRERTKLFQQFKSIEKEHFNDQRSSILPAGVYSTPETSKNLCYLKAHVRQHQNN